MYWYCVNRRFFFFFFLFLLPLQISSFDLVVYGCGVLGQRAIHEFILTAPRSIEPVRIAGITRTTTNHQNIRDFIGSQTYNNSYILTLKSEEGDSVDSYIRSSKVLFCAPPSKFTDYPAAVRACIEKYLSPDVSCRNFVFTSSGAVFGEKNGELISESSQVIGGGEGEVPDRISRLLRAEEHVLNLNKNHEKSPHGVVLRLAGLYTRERGAHSYWLRPSVTTVNGRGDAFVNLLHYDDAAAACVAALKGERRGTFIVSDSNPMTRKAICEAALNVGGLTGNIPEFLGERNGDDDVGKVYDTTKFASNYPDWELRYKNFELGIKPSVRALLEKMKREELIEWCKVNSVNVDNVGIKKLLIMELLSSPNFDYEETKKRMADLEQQARDAIMSCNDPITGPSSFK